MGSELDLTMVGVLSGECNEEKEKETRKMRANAWSDYNNGLLHLFRKQREVPKGLRRDQDALRDG